VNPRRLVPDIKSDSLRFNQRYCAYIGFVGSKQAHYHKSTVTSAMSQAHWHKSKQGYLHTCPCTATGRELCSIGSTQRHRQGWPHTSALPQVRQGVQHTWSCTVTGRECCTPVTIVFGSTRVTGKDGCTPALCHKSGREHCTPDLAQQQVGSTAHFML
jgi:hypothetical protein